MLRSNEIRNYSNWIGKNAQYVRDSAEKLGGWAQIFAGGLPGSLEIHRVRNYFNLWPQNLRFIKASEQDDALKKVSYFSGDRVAKFFKHQYDSSKADLKAATALTGIVLRDERGRYWYHMDPMGAVYHVGDGDGALTDYLHQVFMPGRIAKLVCPDGKTMGSHEIIIEGHYAFQTLRGSSDSLFGPSIDANSATQGSYNYGETTTSGTRYHNLLDVDTHKKETRYVNPPHGNMLTPLKQRTFPDLNQLKYQFKVLRK